MNNVREKLRLACDTLSIENLEVLVDMYESERLIGTEAGSPFVIDQATRISVEQGAMLHKLIRDNRFERTLEIGFAYGYSTVWILDALRERAGSLHVAVDPFEKSYWNGIGLAQAARITTAARLEWLADYAIQAVPALIKQGEKFDFVYIDGNHRFDDVIVDFYLADQVTRVGGLIVMDDMWMDSIKAACDFILRNRAYEFVPQPERNISVLKKLRDDDRNWDHFVPFRAVSYPKRAARKSFFKKLFR